MTPLSNVQQPRQHELTALQNRELFDLFPGSPRHSGDTRRWQEFRMKYHQAQRLEAVNDFPLQLDFELNSTCQMSCAFCLHGSTQVEKSYLSFEQYKNVIKQGAEYGLCSVKLNYINEPLMLDRLPEYIRYAKAHGVLNVYFATNGLLLDKERSMQLIEAGTSKIMISIDAATKETYQAMRSNSGFDRIVANIKNFIALRDSMALRWPLVRVNFVQTPKNIHEIGQFIQQWRGVADAIGFQRQVQLPGQDDDMLPSTCYHEDDFRCSFPYKLMTIDSNGDILPCCTFSGKPMAIGHVDTMTIKAAWDSKNMRYLRDTHRVADYRHIPRCLHCIGGEVE